MTACNEFGLKPIVVPDPPMPVVVVQEQFLQEPEPGLDLLFVIDNTGSMVQEQAAMDNAYGDLAAGLGALGITWQIGVTTTTMDGSDAGLLLGSPWILTPDTPQVADRFTESVQVGTESISPEAGLAAATRALSLTTRDGLNAGFRRPDAALHVIFVSDSDDSSEEHLLNPVEDFLAAMKTETQRTSKPALASGMIGESDSPCAGDNGGALRAPRYHEVIESTGGIALSICDDDFGELLSRLGEDAVAYPTRFDLRETPDPESIRVSLDGLRISDGDVVVQEPPTVVFDEAPSGGALIEGVYTVRGS